MLRALRSAAVVLCVFAAAPAAAQQPTPGPGKLDLTIIPAGWLAFTPPDVQPEPSFGAYLLGGSLTWNPGPVAVEAELSVALGRSQELQFGSVTRTEKTPEVVMDSVSLIVPVAGGGGTVVPYGSVALVEYTFMRTREVGQADTETFLGVMFGGGLKWYGRGRLGFRGDYRYGIMRSRFDAPGTFVGRERRNNHRFYGALIVKLIER